MDRLSSLRSLRTLRFGRRLKYDHDPPISAAWTHEPALQTSKREVSATRPHQRVQVQLLLINARPRVRPVIDRATSATGRNAPPMGKSISEGPNFHVEQNKNIRPFVKAC
jgi:hypothetical protein